ncbi:DUF977 family protein [Escherichia coli]|uniref:DUF977 family protein n=1 Tax=Escherichia coli TaxID=562 RepID=UPI0005CD851E|nr:DUF977 family protein [Escherichia coli]EHW2741467.1 DUF977 family protein [Escherichia coli]EHX7847982.1 DUF977 family protein [Escherichia coli]EHY2965797.1 DUF977 family protein [Escherichia coli]ELX0475421.1 DUF977 family protein [Escherichia coli]ELX0480604.1 DUF977 family protein [Escherichia coli]
MPRSNPPQKQEALIQIIIEEVNLRGRLTVNQASEMLSLHRGTTEKYFREATIRGGLIRHGRCGLFRDQRAVLDFDLQRFSYNSGKSLVDLPPDFRGSAVMRRVIEIVGRMPV